MAGTGVGNIDTSLSTLDTMIAAIPDASRPIYTQMGQIMVALQRQMHVHIQENNDAFDDVKREVMAINVRVQGIESGNAAMLTQLSAISATLDGMKTQFDDPTL